MEVDKQIVLDLLEQPSPALSSTGDMPAVEAKPDVIVPAAPEPEVEITEGEGKTIVESATTPDSPSANEEPKKAQGVQKRLDELTRQREEERRRADQAHEETLRLLTLLEERGKPPPEAKVQQHEGPQRPQRSDYPDPDSWDTAVMEYAESKAAWSANKEIQRLDQERRQQAEQEVIQAGLRSTQESYQERVEKIMGKYADFDVVARRPDVEISQGMAQAIYHSERGPELQYYLGAHPDEAKRITRMSPPLQLVELGLIQARLDLPAIKPISAAPKPIKPITPGSEPNNKDPSEMSMEEYASYRKAQRGSVRH